jgi:hypothetical protein
VQQRDNFQDCAAALGCSVALVHKMVKKEKVLVPHKATVKPLLTDRHKQNRLDFVRNEVSGGGWFNPMYDRVHIDEKWFNAKKITQKMILVEGEREPHQTTRHKSYIPKCMFFCAVARPQLTGAAGRAATNGTYSYEGKIDYDSWSFDGKICCLPVVEWRPARRRSVNRERGVMEPHPVSMNAAKYKEFILELLLPAIANRVPPAMKSQTIWIQHDNATPHHIDEELVRQKSQELGVDCRLYFQPSQSPDLNVCDLSFFSSIQALYHKLGDRNRLLDIINGVYEAWDRYNPRTLNRCWVTLLSIYNKVIESN